MGAAERFAEIRDKLAELRRNGKLTSAGYRALPDLDQIADSFDTAGKRQD